MLEQHANSHISEAKMKRLEIHVSVDVPDEVDPRAVCDEIESNLESTDLIARDGELKVEVVNLSNGGTR